MKIKQKKIVVIQNRSKKNCEGIQWLQKIRSCAGVLLSCMLLAGITVTPCYARGEISQNFVHISPDKETGDAIKTPADDPKPVQLTSPASFQAKALKNGIRLSWKEAAHAQKYLIYRKICGEKGGYTLIKTTKKCVFTDKTAAYGVSYYYRIRAVSISGKATSKSPFCEKVRCCTYHIDPSKPMVALTFDDGPSQYTPGILDTLEKYESRATFFEVGNRVNQYPDTVMRISRMGCEIGNHSYDHALLGNASAAKIHSEISSTDAKIKAITGKKTTLLRPPYGSIGSSLRRNAGLPMILWSIDTLDWKYRNADTVYRSVINHVKDGDIILMHDLYSSTCTAVQKIVPELRKRGYQLVTVSELAQYKKVTLSAGKSYSQMRRQTN